MSEQINELKADKKKADTKNDTDFGEGIFDMAFIHEVNAASSLPEAKKLALKKVVDSKANDSNKRKARAMIEMSNSIKKLIFAMTNFSLAHQGLGVLQ